MELKQIKAIQKVFYGDVVLVYIGTHYQVWCEVVDSKKQEIVYIYAGVYGDEVREMRVLGSSAEMIAEIDKPTTSCYYPDIDEDGRGVWRQAWAAACWPARWPNGPVAAAKALPSREELGGLKLVSIVAATRGNSDIWLYGLDADGAAWAMPPGLPWRRVDMNVCSSR